MRRPLFIARQACRPSGLVGRALLRLMEWETSHLNQEALDALALVAEERVLEVGYGHGRTVAAAAACAPGALLAGIDVSEDAARFAARRCRAAIATGRVDLRVGDSAALPWPDGAFDKALSVHTLYFWPEPGRDLREVRRVLRPGGRFVLAFRERTEDAVATFPPQIYRFYSTADVIALLTTAGFSAVDIHTAKAGPDLRIAVAVAGPG